MMNKRMKSKLHKLNLVHHATNVIMTEQFDFHSKNNTKRKTSIDQSDISTTPSMLNSPTNDDFSTSDSKRTPTSSSSSPSKMSHDELLLTPDTLTKIERLYILNEIYPSIELQDLNETPLAFLGSEKFLRIRIDWTRVRYPLSSYYIEIIIDLILTRPSFIREIPKVTQFNLYRPLIQIIPGHLFFDHGEHKATIHRCHRKLVNYKFTIDDLASIHRREFYIINYNVTREQRFINLYENLFQIHFYRTTPGISPIDVARF